DENGCPQYDTTYVTIYPNILIEFEVQEKLFCIGDSAFIKLKNRDNTIFTWFDGKNELEKYINKVGTFEITARDTITGCRANITIEIKNHPYVNAKIDIQGSNNPCIGESKYLK